MDGMMQVTMGCIQELIQQGEYLLRVFVAMILGLLIGNERKNRNKSAGLRTHAIVALGSALMMVVSKYGFWDVAQGDGARLAAQVVSGVGFLGAGMIFVRNNLVSGLTTAAGIWTTAGVGLTVGAGMYLVGTLSTGMLVLMQSVLHGVSYGVPSGGTIRIILSNSNGDVQKVSALLEEHHVEIQGIQIRKCKKDKLALELDVLYPLKMDKSVMFSGLLQQDGVLSAGG